MPGVDEVDNGQQRAKRLFFAAFVSVVFGVYICLDLIIASMFNDPLPAIFLMILVVGQLTLICVWGTLVEGTFWIRLPWTLLLLVVSWAALSFGVAIDHYGAINAAEVMGLGLVWFYGFAISYVPLKIAAWFFGWRVIHVDRHESAGDSRIALRDMMLGTAILAITLAISKQFLPGELPSWDDVLRYSNLYRPDTQLAFVMFSIVSLIVKLPCIWIALASARSRVVWYSIVWILVSGALGMLELLLLIVFIGRIGSQLNDFLIALVCGHAVMAGMLIAVLFGLRQFGYQLKRKAKSSQPASAI